MSNNYLQFITILFLFTTFISVILFFAATRTYKIAWIFTLIVLVVQGGLAQQNFYLADIQAVPPRIGLFLLPSILAMLWAFFTDKGKIFIKSIDLEVYTYLHTVRIVVEVVILLLFMQGLMPKSMTFEGRNFDIFSGISAPIIAYLYFSQKTLSKNILIIWNVLCLFLVLQVVITGILAAPTILQKIEFEQPNVAVLQFPFVWLPTVIVPIVIFGHLVSLKRLFHE